MARRSWFGPRVEWASIGVAEDGVGGVGADAGCLEEASEMGPESVDSFGRQWIHWKFDSRDAVRGGSNGLAQCDCGHAQCTQPIVDVDHRGCVFWNFCAQRSSGRIGTWLHRRSGFDVPQGRLRRCALACCVHVGLGHGLLWFEHQCGSKPACGFTAHGNQCGGFGHDSGTLGHWICLV